jgi:methionyl-tRNA synthetase
MQKNYYITTPIYYVNDVPHIGHAYTTLACDVLARYKRLTGYTVKFLTGTDEHGQKVEQSAQKAGITPLDYATKYSAHFQRLAKTLNISNDDFIRTTEPRHKQAAQALWHKLEANGFIYLGSYAGWYSVRDEAFYQESELVNGKAPSGAPVEWVEEPSYFFKLSAFEQPLLDYYAKHPDAIAPKSRYNEVLSFVKGGLKDLSISRTSFAWGIPVPNNEKHIMYVWLDALANYLTAIGYPDEQSPDFKNFWENVTHVVGKDIVRFHAVYWPAFLMAAGLHLPQRVYAHGWWTNEGQKISKSVGNVIDPYALIDTYGLNAVRYFLLREVPFGQDGDFSHTAMIRRINTDLSNDLGNLCQRVFSQVFKNCEGINDSVRLEINDASLLTIMFAEKGIGSYLTSTEEYSLIGFPVIERGLTRPWEFTEDMRSRFVGSDLIKDQSSVVSLLNRISFKEEDNVLLKKCYALPAIVSKELDAQAFHKALEEIWNVIGDANRYVDAQAPWALKKTDTERMKVVLYTLVETIRCLGLILQPFMPDAMAELLDFLHIPNDKREWVCVSSDHALKTITIDEPKPLFPRFVEDV